MDRYVGRNEIYPLSGKRGETKHFADREGVGKESNPRDVDEISQTLRPASMNHLYINICFPFTTCEKYYLRERRVTHYNVQCLTKSWFRQGTWPT